MKHHTYRPSPLPLGLIITIAVQIITTIWWAASLDMRVKTQDEALRQLEHQLSALAEELNNWEAKTYDRK